MNIILNQKQVNLILENSGAESKIKQIYKEYSIIIREILKNLYEPKGSKYWGKVINENCETETGVLNVYPHSETDNWSILNRFDTNSRVRNELKQYHKKFGKNEKFNEWLLNSPYLFDVDFKTEGSNENELLKKLVELNKETIDKGLAREDKAESIIRNAIRSKEGSQVRRFCSGDKRDMYYGQDIEVVLSNGEKRYFQVKPFYFDVVKITDNVGKILYTDIITGSFKYYDKNKVNYLLFIDESLERFIIFKNMSYTFSRTKEGLTKVSFSREPISSGGVDFKIETEEEDLFGGLFF
jgi:hypothetical protein